MVLKSVPMDLCVCTSVVGQIVWTSVINLLYSSLVAAPRVVQVSTKLTEGFRAIETLSSDWSRSALLSCVTTEAGAFSSTWLWLEHAPVPFVIANETQVLLGLSFLCMGGKLSRQVSFPWHPGSQHPVARSLSWTSKGWESQAASRVPLANVS